MKATDKELMARVVDGDGAAFEELMLRHQKPLVRWIWSMLGDAEEAQDVAQDAFLQAYSNAEKFNPRYNFKTWLYTIARNRAISIMRRRKHQVAEIGTAARGEERTAPEADDSWASLAVDENPDPREVLSSKEEAEWLLRAMDRLDEGHREVLRLKYFAGMKSREIAEVMELEVGTVWSRVHHGLKKLRALAEEVGNGIE
ncbi:RNA polymerase sigma factor [bacterium]|nr:RNA polymerase sigma factor [bacterium]